jgi:RNA polymerase sigma-70 factor (ECF subfamily)
MKEFSDQELVERLKCGENPALGELMGRYKHRLFAFIRRYTGSDDVAYDLLQETFTKLYFSASTYKPEYKFSTWLYQIALNLCRDYGRKKKLAQFFSIDDEESGFNFADSSPDPEAIAQSSQAVRQINQAIDTLPHKLKTALILFALDDNSQEECAQMLGVTAKTIETRVHRARKLLEEKLYKNR